MVNVSGGEKQLLPAVASGTGWPSLAQAITWYAPGATAGMTALRVAAGFDSPPGTRVGSALVAPSGTSPSPLTASRDR